MQLGYIGLGNMGGALARRLMREHQLRAFDLRPEVLGRFAEFGAVPTQSAQWLARESEMVMTCLPTSAEVRDVLFGEGRVAEVLRPGQIIADMTTGDPGETREMAARLAEKGVHMIDAPVSGGPHGANAGTIAIMIGAPADLFAKVKPIFETISPNIFHTGNVGTGHVMKLVNNVISAGVRAVTFEALAMGIKNGFEPRDLHGRTAEGQRAQRHHRARTAQIAEGRFQCQLHAGADAQGCAAGDQARHRQCNTNGSGQCRARAVSDGDQRARRR